MARFFAAALNGIKGRALEAEAKVVVNTGVHDFFILLAMVLSFVSILAMLIFACAEHDDKKHRHRKSTWAGADFGGKSDVRFGAHHGGGHHGGGHYGDHGGDGGYGGGGCGGG